MYAMRSVRQWIRKNEHHLDRDEDATKNIPGEGLKIISSGTGDYTGGGLNQTSFEKHRSVNPQAYLSLVNG